MCGYNKFIIWFKSLALFNLSPDSLTIQTNTPDTDKLEGAKHSQRIIKE